MRDQIIGRLRAVQRSFMAFTGGQKTIAVIGGVAVLLGAFMVFRWASTPSYAPLFTNMDAADASAVVDKLAAAGTPYQLTDGGTTVLVPQNDVYSARIKLSGEGLPGESSSGYSLLDKQSLSTSKQQQDVNYKRAMEGELDTTIEALDPVDTAVVHIAQPEDELFSEDKKPVTASVLVSTKPGATLTSTQVQAVVHLVASSISGLDPKNVTVTDSTGNVLSAAGDGVTGVADNRSQQVSDFEKRMSSNITAMLDRVVGPGNSAVQVTADLDFDSTKTETTRYFANPKVAPLSIASSEETYAGDAAGNAASSGGTVGPDGQLNANGNGTGTGSGNSYGKKASSQDNAVDKTIENREAAPGGVKALNVGIVVDTRSLGATTPQQLQQLVAAGVGINTKRGDQLAVNPMPFNRNAEKAAAAELAAAKKADASAATAGMIKQGGIAGAVLLAALVAWMKGRKRRKMRDEATSYVVEQLRQRSEPTPLPPNPPVAELSGPDPAQLRLAARDEIVAMVERQPEEVAQLLRGWLVEADR